MPDAPDWYSSLPGSDRNVLGDLGELAVRLGSIVSFDRQGVVMRMDNFETGLSHWIYTGYATDSYQKVVVSPVFNGAYAVELGSGKTPTALAKINCNFPVVSEKKCGIELAFRPSAGGHIQHLSFLHFDGDHLSNARVIINMHDQILQYLDENGNYVTFGTISDLAAMTEEWNIVKLVADFENECYDRLILNKTTYDMSGYTLRQTGPYTNIYMQFAYYNYGDGVASSIMVIDSFIYTIEEI